MILLKWPLNSFIKTQPNSFDLIQSIRASDVNVSVFEIFTNKICRFFSKEYVFFCFKMSYPDSRGVKTQQQFADKIDYINRAIMKWKKVPSNEKHIGKQ